MKQRKFKKTRQFMNFIKLHFELTDRNQLTRLQRYGYIKQKHMVKLIKWHSL